MGTGEGSGCGPCLYRGKDLFRGLQPCFVRADAGLLVPWFYDFDYGISVLVLEGMEITV